MHVGVCMYGEVISCSMFERCSLMGGSMERLGVLVLVGLTSYSTVAAALTMNP